MPPETPQGAVQDSPPLHHLVVHHAGYVVFQMAEVAAPRGGDNVVDPTAPREFFGKILERIGRLRLEPG